MVYRSMERRSGKVLQISRRILAALALLALSTGCSMSPLAKRASAFATAATAAAKNTANAYALVEQTHHDAEVQAMVANFDAQGFDPARIKPFMPVEDMEARTKILDGLRQVCRDAGVCERRPGDDRLRHAGCSARKVAGGLKRDGQHRCVPQIDKRDEHGYEPGRDGGGCSGPRADRAATEPVICRQFSRK